VARKPLKPAGYTYLAERISAGGQLGRLTGRWNDPPRYGILDITSSPEGTVWVGGGFGCLAITTDHVSEYAPAVARFAWLNGKVWARQPASTRLVVDMDHNQTAQVPIEPGYAIRTAPNNALWINHWSQLGVWRTMDGTAWESVPGLESYHIEDFWFDVMGNVWLTATAQHALLCLREQSIMRIPLPPHRYVTPQSITTMLVANDGLLWVGTNTAGLWQWNGSTWTRAKQARDHTQTGIAGHRIFAICQDARERLWIGTNEGVSTLLDGVWYTMFVAPHPPDEQGTLTFLHTPYTIYTLRHTADGRLWCGSVYGDVFWFDTTQDTYPAHPSELTKPGELDTFGLILL